MTAPTYVDGRVLQPAAGQPLDDEAHRVEGRLLPPHKSGVTRDALDALARTTTRTRNALASQAEERTGSRQQGE